MVQQERLAKGQIKLLEDKEITIIMKDNRVIEGIVHDVINENKIVISKNGNWKDRETVDLTEAKGYEVSEYPYYSLQHKTTLRECKQPRFEFRFSREDLDKLFGKYATINYDGKIIEGEITGYRFKKNGPNEISIKSQDEVKVIEDYRLRTIEITGSTKFEHEQLQELRELEEELFLLSEDKFKVEYVDFACREEDPDVLLDKYFLARIEKLKGSNLDLENFEYNWVQEVVKQKEKFANDGDDFYEEVKKARDLTEYYEIRKDFIDEIFIRVKQVNWLKYTNQTIGEIKALEYIYDSGLINE